MHLAVVHVLCLQHGLRNVQRRSMKKNMYLLSTNFNKQVLLAMPRDALSWAKV